MQVYLQGEISSTTVTDRSGRYYFPDLPANKRYSVTPSTALLSFSPVQRSTGSFGGVIRELDFSLSFASGPVTIPPERVRVVGSAAGR